MKVLIDFQPIEEQISSEDIWEKNANEVAIFLRSWDLGKEIGLLFLTSLQIYHLSFLMVTARRERGCTKSFVLEDDLVRARNLTTDSTGHRG